MKRFVLCALFGALCASEARAEVIEDVWIGDLKYRLVTDLNVAVITGFSKTTTKVDVDEVEYQGQKYTTTTITQNALQSCSKLTFVSLLKTTLVGYGAFIDCSKLSEVSLPNLTTLGQSAFSGCNALTSLVVNVEVKSAIEGNGRSFYGIPSDATISYFDPLPEDVVRSAGYIVQDGSLEPAIQMVVKTPPSVTLKSGELVLDEKAYKFSCASYGIEEQIKPEMPEIPAEPTADDFKVVSKDAAIVQEGEIAVTKESIAAPSADTVKIEENKVQLGVTVLKTADLTAVKKEWGEVTLTADDVKVVDGKIVISVPVDSTSGYMVIQTKDAKIETEE